jgi:uncharacterized protein YbjT (DUF2867 family)
MVRAEDALPAGLKVFRRYRIEGGNQLITYPGIVTGVRRLWSREIWLSSRKSLDVEAQKALIFGALLTNTSFHLPSSKAKMIEYP